MAATSFFLGGNTCRGFYSCYSCFCKPKNTFLFVIKGGPGCGKSSFMRRIGNAAEMAGYDVEYVLCSGDPDSLDGVRIPALQLGYVDGTAPHTADPAYPGICGAYLDLGAFYDFAALVAKREEMTETYREYKAYYRTAYDALAAEKGPDVQDPIACDSGFLAAVTCRGLVDLAKPNDYRLVSEQELAQLLRDRKTQWVERHPLWPDTALGVFHGGEFFRKPLLVPPLTEAIQALEKAKTVHDRLEALYNPHTDFSGIYETAEKHIKKYIAKPL